jgi:hypothetical protein
MLHLTEEQAVARWQGLMTDINKDLAEVTKLVNRMTNAEERKAAILAMPDGIGIGTGAMTTLANDAWVAAGKLREDLEEVNFYEHTCLNW